MFTVDLDEARHVKTWRWFRARLDYLLSTDSALARQLRATDQPG